MKPGAPEALRRAIRRRDAQPEESAIALEVAYMRLLCAFRAGAGVRLTADEVWAFFQLDDAVSTAAGNIEQDLLDPDGADHAR